MKLRSVMPTRRPSRGPFCILAAACLASVFPAFGCATSDTASGSLVTSGGVLGNRTLSPNRCGDAERQELFGVLLYTVDDAGANPDFSSPSYRPPTLDVRLIRDAARGDRLDVANARNGGFTTFVPKECKTFAWNMPEVDYTTGDLQGSATVDCTAPSGAHVQGTVRFEQCGEEDPTLPTWPTAVQQE